jgi:uncharacterized repeat protein (TIGR03803 family)
MPRIVSSVAAAALLVAGGVLLLPAGEAYAQTYRMLDDIESATGCRTPAPGVIEGSDGMIYGACQVGGAYDGTRASSGILYRTYRDGIGTTKIFDFDHDTTGGSPTGLIQGSDGTLYGTTQTGGAFGSGTLFRIDTGGTGFNVLYDFDGTSSGAVPTGRLLLAKDGYLYGVTAWGGAGGAGTCYRILPDGSDFTQLCSFGVVGGTYPTGGLIQASDGNFYGTTSTGGTYDDGTVYQLVVTKVGRFVVTQLNVLANFDWSTMGMNPYYELLQGSDGMLYGTADWGGAQGAGTVYKLHTDGSGFTVIANLSSGWPTDVGEDPAALVQTSDGTLYVAALTGGFWGYGTIFSLQTDGSGLTDLHDFDSGSDGTWPWGLVLAPDGNLYGTTMVGNPGSSDEYGTLYSIVFKSPAIWRNYGSGLAGTLGVPEFTSTEPVLGSTLQMTIGNSRGVKTSGTLLAGTTQTSIPIKGGEILVGNVFLYLPVSIAVPNVELDATVPSDPAYAGVALELQVIEADPGAVKGLSFTPGLELVLGF